MILMTSVSEKRGVKNINSEKTGIGYQTLSGNGVIAMTTGTLKLNGITIIKTSASGL